MTLIPKDARRQKEGISTNRHSLLPVGQATPRYSLGESVDRTPLMVSLHKPRCVLRRKLWPFAQTAGAFRACRKNQAAPDKVRAARQSHNLGAPLNRPRGGDRPLCAADPSAQLD